ncbi:MAG: serine O-acetyltransferase [Candidatus Borkfalkiaceae bacterium]|nr:serine O-acetyltransferase [Christensenellaceae bacterium]
MSFKHTFLPDEKWVEKLINYIKKDVDFYSFGAGITLNKNAKSNPISPLSHSSLEKKIYSLVKKCVRGCFKQKGLVCSECGLERCKKNDDCSCSKKAKTVAREFMNSIPDICVMLSKDAEATFKGDPSCEDETIVKNCFPGFFAISVYRVAHEFYIRQVPYLPRILTEYAHSRTGIDINAGAKIGKNFLIDHGTGVVIGETAEIGDDCRIYQGVTLGALSLKGRCSASEKRHPTIGNGVVIYANATILGGRTIIGDNSVIGGNTFIIRSVPAGTKVVTEPTVIDGIVGE